MIIVTCCRKCLGSHLFPLPRLQSWLSVLHDAVWLWGADVQGVDASLPAIALLSFFQICNCGFTCVVWCSVLMWGAGVQGFYACLPASASAISSPFQIFNHGFTCAAGRCVWMLCAASALPLKVFKFNHGFTCVAGWHVWMSSSHCAAFALPGLHSWLYLCTGVHVAGWRVWVWGAGVPGADAHLPAALLQPYPGAAAESSVPRGTRVWIVDQRWAELATSHIPYFLLLCLWKDKFSKLTVEKHYTCTVKMFLCVPVFGLVSKAACSHFYDLTAIWLAGDGEALM